MNFDEMVPFMVVRVGAEITDRATRGLTGTVLTVQLHGFVVYFHDWHNGHSAGRGMECDSCWFFGPCDAKHVELVDVVV